MNVTSTLAIMSNLDTVGLIIRESKVFPLTALPPELIGHIFTLGCPVFAPSKSLCVTKKYQIKLCSISSSLRQIAHETPFLWTSVSVYCVPGSGSPHSASRTQFAGDMLGAVEKRSGVLDLDLAVIYPTEWLTFVPQHNACLAKLLRRARSLYVLMSGKNDETHSIFPIISAPRLKSFTIARKDWKPSWPGPTLFHPDRLDSFQVEEINIAQRLTSGYLNSLPTSHLKKLTAWELSGQFGPSFLARCHRLESLILTDFSPEQSNFGWPPSLRYLRVHLGSTALFSPFGLTPNLVHVDIRSATLSVSQSFDNERPHFPEVLGSLRTLTVEKLISRNRFTSPEYITHVVEVVQRAPNLVAIELNAGLALQVCQRLAGLLRRDGDQPASLSTSVGRYPKLLTRLKLLRIWYASTTELLVDGFHIWRDILVSLIEIVDKIEWWVDDSTESAMDGNLGDILPKDAFISFQEGAYRRPDPSLKDLVEG